MVSKRDKKLIAGVAVGVLALWLLTRQSVSAENQKIGQTYINSDNQKVYVMGSDFKIHEILDPSILTRDQIRSSIRVNSSTINTFVEGASFVCL